MSEQEARSLFSTLTYEEKLILVEFLTALLDVPRASPLGAFALG